jgi:hypothetical protein
LTNVVDKLPQAEVAEELYKELLQSYLGIHGGRTGRSYFQRKKRNGGLYLMKTRKILFRSS